MGELGSKGLNLKASIDWLSCDLEVVSFVLCCYSLFHADAKTKLALDELFCQSFFPCKVKVPKWKFSIKSGAVSELFNYTLNDFYLASIMMNIMVV